MNAATSTLIEASFCSSTSSSSSTATNANAHTILYTDVIHSILPFLYLGEIPLILRLNREWRAAASSFNVRRGSNLPFKIPSWPPQKIRTPRFNDLKMIGSQHWMEIRKHPNAPFLRYFTTLEVRAQDDIADNLSNFFPSLTFLSVSGPFGAKGMSIIKGCKNLTHLKIEYNHYCDVDEGASSIADVINQHESLITVHLDGQDVSEKCLSSIAGVAAACDKITKMTLFGRRDPPGTHLADAIKQSRSLKVLRLNDFNLDAATAEIAMKHKSVTELDLTSNYLGQDTVDAISIAISHQQNNNLTDLRLSDCLLSEEEDGDEGALALADALKQNSTLVVLQLDRCEIGDEGAIAIADAIRHNTSLTDLSMRDNKIGLAGASFIADSLQHNERITVDIRGNSLSKAESSSIASRCDVASFDVPYDSAYDSSIRLYLPGDEPNQALQEIRLTQLALLQLLKSILPTS